MNAESEQEEDLWRGINSIGGWETTAWTFQEEINSSLGRTLRYHRRITFVRLFLCPCSAPTALHMKKPLNKAVEFLSGFLDNVQTLLQQHSSQLVIPKLPPIPAQL